MSQLRFFNFWSWLIRGSGGKPGYYRLVNKWLLFHGIIGVLLAFRVKTELAQCANSVLLPLAGIIVGLSFAWAGNAQALLQTSEMDDVAEKHPGGFVEFVFVYQTAVLVILTTLVLWSFAGLSVFDIDLAPAAKAKWEFVVKSFLFGISSMALRECWHAVLGAQWMLLTRREIRKAKDRSALEHDSKNISKEQNDL
jgi:hypothetical protein